MSGVTADMRQEGEGRERSLEIAGEEREGMLPQGRVINFQINFQIDKHNGHKNMKS